MTSAPAPERLESLVSTCRAITATSPATKTRWSTSDATGLKSRTSSSTPSRTSGGTRVTASANSTIWELVERRTEKNSGLRPRMSSSGSASAKPESTASWAPRTRAARAKAGSALGARKVKRSSSGSERLRARDLEALGEALLEPVGPVVGMVSGPLPRQQSAGHRIFRRDELDHERPRHAAKPVEELGHGDVAGDRDVVDKCEGKRQLGSAAVEQRAALLPAPAEPRRRIDDVHGERQDSRLAFVAQGSVEPVDDEAVRVHRHDVLGAFRRDPRVPALVAAEVPDQARALRGDRIRDEARLALRVLGGVRRVRAVFRPGRPVRLPAEAADQPLEAADVGQDQLLLEPRLAQLALEVGLLLLVAALEPLVEDDVRERAAAKQIARGQEPARLVRRDPLQAAPEPRLERHLFPGLQQQRVEEEHAELAVAGPGLALAELLEGADIDEQRLRPAELDVVGRRVLEDQALLDCPPEQLELQQRGVPQHREGPLVRIRD